MNKVPQQPQEEVASKMVYILHPNRMTPLERATRSYWILQSVWNASPLIEETPYSKLTVQDAIRECKTSLHETNPTRTVVFFLNLMLSDVIQYGSKRSKKPLEGETCKVLPLVDPHKLKQLKQLAVTNRGENGNGNCIA
jgi:hypothetical protein